MSSSFPGATNLAHVFEHFSTFNMDVMYNYFCVRTVRTAASDSLNSCSEIPTLKINATNIYLAPTNQTIIIPNGLYRIWISMAMLALFVILLFFFLQHQEGLVDNSLNRITKHENIRYRLASNFLNKIFTVTRKIKTLRRNINESQLLYALCVSYLSKHPKEVQ